MSYSLVIVDANNPDTVTWVEEIVSDSKESTTYRAYFYAIHAAMKRAIEMGYTDKVIELCTDLKGAVNQFVQWSIFDGDGKSYKYLYMQSDLLQEIIELKHKFNKVRIKWVRREDMPIQEIIT